MPQRENVRRFSALRGAESSAVGRIPVVVARGRVPKVDEFSHGEGLGRGESGWNGMHRSSVLRPPASDWPQVAARIRRRVKRGRPTGRTASSAAVKPKGGWHGESRFADDVGPAALLSVPYLVASRTEFGFQTEGAELTADAVSSSRLHVARVVEGQLQQPQWGSRWG